MLKVVSPYDQSLIKEIPYVGEKEIEQALTTAYNLFQDQSNWLQPHERIAILERTISIMNSRIEELTKLAASEGGKPYQDSKVEILRAINGVKLAAEHISRLKGEQIPMGLTKASENRIAFTTREPIGVVAAISAFNHPLNLIIHQTVTAIAAGCPVIVKPASSTPLSCLYTSCIQTIKASIRYPEFLLFLQRTGLQLIVLPPRRRYIAVPKQPKQFHLNRHM